MAYILNIVLSFLLSVNIHVQDIAALIKEGDRQEASMNEAAAYQIFLSVLKLQPVNIYALNKCSELCSRIGKRQSNIKSRDDYYQAAKTYASIALKLNPINGEANCVMAIALGRISLSKSGKEKIQFAREIKKHIDVAIKNDPNNFKAWHVLGRWHYELSTLSMIERTAVKVLYGGVPIASIKESIRAFEKVKVLNVGFVLNYFEMSKAYKKNGQDAKAIAALNTLLQLPNHTEDDAFIKLDAKKLLKEWQ